MSEPVKPALSTEEWARKEVRTEAWGEVYLANDGDMGIRGANKTMILNPEKQHAVAALCLHEQPFGFTWDMVDAIRATAMMAEVHDEYDFAQREAAITAADLIESLLPPREP